MDMILDLFSWICIGIGTALTLIGAIGILRLPDVFARMHGAGMADTLGLALILLGLGFQAGFNIVAIKLFLIFIFVMFTSPTTTHALARAALEEGLAPALTPKAGGTEHTDSKKEADPSKT